MPRVRIRQMGWCLARRASQAHRPARREGLNRMDDCYSCGEEMPKGECPKSKRKCGHHCNHSWSHDRCDWCGEEFGEVDAKHGAGEAK